MAKRGLNIFNSIKLAGVPSSSFDLSHDKKYTFDMGELVPTCCLEVIPGDRFDISIVNFLRFTPLVAPVMHKIKVTTDFYFVPNRILWDEWDKWITTDNDVAEAPYIQLSSFVLLQGTIADYMGLPVGAYESQRVNALPFAAYFKIYDEFYRDQNLQNEEFIPLIAGDNAAYAGKINNEPLHRAWMHDYFTAALPFAQKGDVVQLPLTIADNQVVEYQNNAGTTDAGILRNTSGTILTTGTVTAGTGPSPLTGSMQVGGNPAAYDPNGTLVVDVQSDAVDINTVRRAFRLQEWLERLARGGSRYKETILSMFGVNSSDARLQRPEFIGRNVQNMVISEVLSSAETLDSEDATVNPVGQMAGHGISAGGDFNGSYYAEEHGWIIGLVSVQPDTTYQDGLHKKFTRFDRLDYAWPLFANIGEQEVLNSEVHAFHNDPEGIFGYVPRYAEYKFENSTVAGEFREQLNFWTFGRRLDTDVALNDSFIQCRPPVDPFAVQIGDKVLAHTMHSIRVRRKLPKFGVPTI
ncbi:MAG: major capsid protein [Microviridae sp.]|nr:MAG: major capsid protein [Microviridae sp.]